MPDPIKSLFEATKSKKIFLDEADFKSQLSKDPQGVFNAVSDSKLFIDFDDFQNTLGLKKKEVSQISGKPSVPTSPSESQLPSAPKLTYSDIEGVIAKAVNTGDALRNMRESAKGSSRLGIPGVPTSTEQFARAEAEYKSAMAEKDSILKEYAVDINKPVDNIIKRGESGLFFDGDVFDEGKARKHIEAVTAKYGGGPLLQEQMVANMRNRLVEEKTQKESKPFIDNALKKRGINMDQKVDSVFRSITQPQLDRAKQLSTDAEAKKTQLLDTSKNRANELTNTFSSFVDGLNKQIEAGTMKVDQAKILFDQEKDKYQSAIKSVDNEYRSNVQKMNANLRSRYSRIDNELKKLTEGVTDSDILKRLPKEQQDAIKAAYVEGQGNYVNFKNEQRKEKDITAGWMMPFGQFTGLLGRGIASGFTGTLASFGDFLIKNGSSNDFSKWLSSFSTEQEKLAPAKYEWSQPIEKFLSITGTTLGGSAPQMLLGGLAAVIPGAQPVTAAVASGVVSALSESAVEAGDEFSGALMKGKDVVVAKERADEIYKKNMSNAALYAIGGIGNYLAVGKGKILKGFGLELAEELPLSVNQSYEKAVLDGYKKSKVEFVKENPDILVDTFVGTIGMSAAMGGVGKIFTPITNTVPSGKTQFLQEMVQKSGPDAAKAILDMYANNGIIDENELTESKAKVDQLTINDEKLNEAGVTGDQSKMITALGDQEKDLKIKVQAEQDPAVKAVLQKQLSDLQKDVKGVLDGTTPYISFTLPGGGDMTRVMTVREFNALPQEKQDQAIKSADKIAIINDAAANTLFNEKKKQLGNQSADKGAYTNEVAEQPKVPAIQVDKPVIETNTLAEVDRVKALAPEAEDGATFDLDGKKYEGKGLIIPVLSENTTIEELTPQKVADFVEANKAKLGGSTKAGIYKFPNSNKVSIDLNIVVDPKYRDIGLEFGKKAGQESLFDLDTFENVKTGADGKNPIKFNDQQFSEISKALSEGKMPDVFGAKMTIEERLGGEIAGDVDQKVEMAQKALDATGVKINMINNTADFENAVAERKGPAGVEGVFISDTGEILINKELLNKGIADGRVVWHEASHPVINIVRNTNSQLFDQVIAGMQEAAKTNKAVDAVLNWAKDNYGVDGDGVVNDEAVVEMIANLAEGTVDIKDLPTGFKQSVIDFINKIAKALGFEPVLSDTDVAAFKKLVTQISDALTTGRDISEVVGAENVKEYLNTVQAPGVVTGGEFKTQARTTEKPVINVYESKDVEKLNQRSIEDVYNNYDGKAVVINSDPTRVGELILPSGKKVFMYGGPAYLSIKDNVASNVGFATTQISKVNTWMKYVKDVFGNNPGVTLVASQAPTSILSNSYALRYVMDGISMLPKSVLKSSDFKNEFFGKDLVLLKDAFGEKAYNEFVNKYKKADLSDPKVIDEMIAEMAYKVGDDNKPASFKARGAFVANLLGGIAPKSALKGVEGEVGYVSKKPNKFISKQLMDRLGINAEKVMREIGEPSLVDLYMNDGKWGFAVAGFETDPNMNVESVQQGGVKHPLFNAKFPGKNAFILDGAYELNKMFTPVEITGPSGKPYTKTAAQMLAGSMYVKGEPLAEGGSFEYVRTTPAGRRIQASRGRRDLDAKLKAFAQKERELGSTDQEIEQAIRNRFPLIDQTRIDEIMAPVTVAQPTVEEKLETVVQPEGEEKTRGMEKRLGDLDEDTYNKIVDESKTYFSQPNKQTEKAAEEFMKGKSLEYMAEFVTSNPNIPGAVNVWMAAMTAKKLGAEIDAAKKAGDVNKVEMLSAARANIYNYFSAKATELGQTVQAFVSFKNDPAANQFIFNKILKQLEEKGVTGLTDSQKAEIKKMLDDVSTAAAGLPKDMAITKLSHYLGKLTPISAFDIMQAMWYAKILSGITTQSKNFFANMVNTFIEVPVVAMRMSVQTGSLQPIFYAMKGLGGGTLKGLVKAGDILKSGVTSKAEDKFFNNDNLLEYFTWSDTKIGKGFGGAVGKVLDFPLLFETSPRALKFVGRSLTASDALFSTANQEAVANMLAFAQAKQEGLKGNVYNRVQQILNNTKQSVVDAKAQATGEGFKPGTVQHKRRTIEIVNQKRGEDIVQKAEEMGKRATLTNEPEGFTRGIYLMATKIQETMPISKVMIPFTRIVANVSEMMINFSPAGTYRAVTGIKNPKFSFKFTPSGDNKLTNDQRADLFIKSMIGITALTVLANNIGDDEDDWFDITAGGPTDFAKKYELMKGGWRPYTITFKDGTKINYAEWPVAGALSALGTVLDVDRYGNVEDPEWIDKMVIGAAGYMSSIYDKSLLKGISDFVDIFRPTGKYGAGSDDFIKRTVENTTKFGAQQAKALTLSNFSQQALKLTDEYKDNPIKEAKGAEVFYRDIPIINDGLNPIVDVFGDPVTYATTERLLPWMSVSDEKKDQVLAYLNRNNVFVGMAKEKPMINLDNGDERKMTRQELYEYRKLAGKYTKDFLYENISTLKDINAMENGKEMMKQVVADFTSAARDRAYAEIIIK
jgi:hypothetical protein